MKPIKFAIAIFLVNPNKDKEFLIVKRPADDDRLPNVWGLPAVTVKDSELPEGVVRRIGREKLNTDVEPTEFLGIKRADRGDYDLILMDVKARLTGKEPSVQKAQTINTKYVDQKWTNDMSLLIEAASKGALCSQIVLDVNSISY